MSRPAGSVSHTRSIVIALACLLGVALCIALWYATMEQKWESQRRYGTALGNQPMLAATRLLERHDYQVETHQLLGDVDLARLPDGMLVLADSNGRMTDAQAAQLLAWTRRGNTLVFQPKWEADQDGADAESSDADSATAGPAKHRKRRLKPLDQEDPLGAHVGVVLAYSHTQRESCVDPELQQRLVRAALKADRQVDFGDAGDRAADSGDAAPGLPPAAAGGDDAQDAAAEDEADDEADDEYQLTCVTVPGGGHPLALEAGVDVLAAPQKAGAGQPRKPRPPLWGDPDALTLRTYAEGKGHLVLTATNLFNNGRLPRYDHAELLLALGALAPQRHVVMVHDIGVTPWYLALWRGGRLALGALTVLLGLLLWRAMRRFGPLLPEPSASRRALLEHIEASGNWLWRSQGGRELLLAAARRETLALLQRRAPELRALEGGELAARLARLCGLDDSALRAALHGPAATLPAPFTQQIRLLQQVRKHYEHPERQ